MAKQIRAKSKTKHYTKKHPKGMHNTNTTKSGDELVTRVNTVQLRVIYPHKHTNATFCNTNWHQHKHTRKYKIKSFKT